MKTTNPSVSQIITQVKNLLEGEFRNVVVEGEITNLSLSSSGHWYFTLSDKNSGMSAACFRMDALRNPSFKNLKNGDKVLCSGSLGVYAKRGTFQLIVKRISPVGKGDLKEEFELLKKRLASEGLFDIQVKKEIPLFAKKVAVITAEGAAALQDFLNVYKRRSIWSDIVIIPALVQGDKAPESIRRALFNTIKYSLTAKENGEEPFDAIVLTRGGGSLEDLWAFNDEALAWDIFNCPIPIISAVGHQVDFSISDFVSDLRVETPSAAAEHLTQGQMKIKEKMIAQRGNLLRFNQDFSYKKERILTRFSPKNSLSLIERGIHSSRLRLNECFLDNRLYELTGIHEVKFQLDELSNKMSEVLKTRILKNQLKLEKSIELLGAVNPTSILSRGYSYLTAQDGSVVGNYSDFKKLKKGQDLEINFANGKGRVNKCE